MSESPPPTAHLLLVDDSAENRQLLAHALKRSGYQVHLADDGFDALHKAREQQPDLILLDVMMPGIDGYETCRRLKQDPASKDIPVIFLSALTEVTDKVEAFRAGGADYVTRPFHREELIIRIQHQLTLQNLRHELESQYEQTQQIGQRLLAIVQCISDGIVIADHHHHICFVNPAAERLFGETAKDLLGRSFAWLQTTQESTETLIKQPQGPTLVVEYRMSSILWNGEAAALYSLRDMTLQKQVQQELRAAKEAAEAANVAKSKFLAAINHELRTPLNSILGFSQLISRDGHLNEKQGDYLNIITRSGEHLLSLINDVLEMSKIEAGQMGITLNPVDLADLAHTLESMFWFKAKQKGLDLFVQLSPPLPPRIALDGGKLRQILINLLGNALKFTHQGQVTLRIFGDNQGGGRWQMFFVVTDTGVGIAPEEQAHIFEPFRQTQWGEVQGKGTGLGLSISRNFAQLMGGSLRVTSFPQQGSTFTLQIPGQAMDVPLETAPHFAPTSHPPMMRVLVVDDVEENRHLMLTLLEPQGFVTAIAINGEEAIAQWRLFRPDVILMDMRMPVLDGYEATRRIREEEQAQRPPGSRPTIIIALTVDAFAEQQIAMRECGCDEFLGKPTIADTLIPKILEVYHRLAPVPQSAPSDQDEISHLIKNLGPTWSQRLRECAMAADIDGLQTLLQEWPLKDHTANQTIQRRLDEFDFETLLHWASEASIQR